MRKLNLVVAVLATATATSSIVAASPSHAKPPRPKAELVTKNVTATLTGTTVTVGATVKNKGSKKAAVSGTTFFLSTDRKHSADDPTLGSTSVAPVKPKRSKPAAGTFALPSTLPAGSYYVVACADAGGVVKERKETNNCKGSTGQVTVTTTGGGGGGGGGGTVKISWAVSGGVPGVFDGSVTATATGGTCTADGKTGTCTVSKGASTVTLTASGFAGVLPFQSWGAAPAPATCDGVRSGTGNQVLTFTNPAADQSCVAAYAGLRP